MAKLTLSDITGGYQTVDAYNANNALIEAAIENTLSRDGTAPNTMNAEFDMNSQNINNANIINAQSIVTPSITLDGQAVSLSTTLTGGLDASEVTYDAGTLTDKLNDEFPKLADAETIAGAWTFSDALTLSAGLGVTGNITVTGNVDGVDIDALNTAAVQKTTAVSGHTRAGNMQLVNDGQSYTSFDVVNSIVEDTFETVGPTGSGATNIFADIDAAIAAGATALMFKARMTGVTADANGFQVILYCASNDGSPSIANDKDYTLYLANNTAAGGDDVQIYTDIIVPVDANGIFKCAWSEINCASFSEIINLYYKGFYTD